ncbi:hypothetical protein ACN9TB_00200 [Lactococcus lactis]
MLLLLLPGYAKNSIADEVDSPVVSVTLSYLPMEEDNTTTVTVHFSELNNQKYQLEKYNLNLTIKDGVFLSSENSDVTISPNKLIYNLSKEPTDFSFEVKSVDNNPLTISGVSGIIYQDENGELATKNMAISDVTIPNPIAESSITSLSLALTSEGMDANNIATVNANYFDFDSEKNKFQKQTTTLKISHGEFLDSGSIGVAIQGDTLIYNSTNSYTNFSFRVKATEDVPVIVSGIVSGVYTNNLGNLAVSNCTIQNLSLSLKQNEANGEATPETTPSSSSNDEATPEITPSSSSNDEDTPETTPSSSSNDEATPETTPSSSSNDEDKKMKSLPKTGDKTKIIQ